jgi:hypothetical protein
MRDRILDIYATYGEYIRRLVPLLANSPHHKHVGQQTNRQPSDETCLEEVMQVIIPQVPPPEAR